MSCKWGSLLLLLHVNWLMSLPLVGCVLGVVQEQRKFCCFPEAASWQWDEQKECVVGMLSRRMNWEENGYEFLMKHLCGRHLKDDRRERRRNSVIIVVLSSFSQEKLLRFISRFDSRKHAFARVKDKRTEREELGINLLISGSRFTWKSQYWTSFYLPHILV